jgi:hypothetical protein
VLVGQAAGSAIFGTMAMLVAFLVVRRLPMGDCARLAQRHANEPTSSAVSVPGAAAGNTIAPRVQ